MRKLLLLLLLALPSFGAIAIVQGQNGATIECNSGGAAGGDYSCNYGTTPTVGNLLIVTVFSYNTNATTCTDNQTPANTYTARTNTALSGNEMNSKTFTAPVVTASGTFTVTCGVAAGTYRSIHLYEISGHNTTTPIDQIATPNVQSGVQASCTVGPVTTTESNELVFVTVAHFASAITPTAGSGYTMGAVSAPGGNGGVGADEYQLGVAAGSVSASMTLNTNSSGCATTMITIKEAGAGPAYVPQLMVVN